MDENERAILIDLFLKLHGTAPSSIAPLKEQASSRKTFRLSMKGRSVVGVINLDLAENRAFIGFSRHFHKLGLPVPEILSESSDGTAYITEDLGDTCLLDLVEQERSSSGQFPEKTTKLYQSALRSLVAFQTRGIKGLDLSLCYQGERFDQHAMREDLMLFLDQFLRPSGVQFDEATLLKEFEALLLVLAKAESGYFMYRDFQARNILVRADKLYFIDYQSGRIGPAEYDVASLLYQSKADLPDSLRENLLSYYIGELEKIHKFDSTNFRSCFQAFVVLRLLQALGAYGRAGFAHGKSYFLSSIPYAVSSLEKEIAKVKAVKLEYLGSAVTLAAALFKK